MNLEVLLRTFKLLHRVLGFFSSRLNWDPPTRKRVCPRPLVPGGGTHSLAGGGEVPISDEGQILYGTLGLYLHFPALSPCFF